jgi:glycosyltransferase involved in cell wall biosynthesis
MSIELSVVVPVFNEEVIIPELYRRLKESASKVTEDFELIFINDGSKYYTLEKLVDLTKIDHRVKFIN